MSRPSTFRTGFAARRLRAAAVASAFALALASVGALRHAPETRGIAPAADAADGGSDTWRWLDQQTVTPTATPDREVTKSATPDGGSHTWRWLDQQTVTPTATADGEVTSTATPDREVTKSATPDGDVTSTATPDREVTPVASPTATLAPSLLPYVSGAHVLHTATPTPTPTTTPTPSATPIPWDSVVTVGNHTGGQLCYEVYGTGIGRKCFPGGEHRYGRFQTGDYVFFVEMRCGAAELPWFFPGGRFVHDFWCP